MINPKYFFVFLYTLSNLSYSQQLNEKVLKYQTSIEDFKKNLVDLAKTNQALPDSILFRKNYPTFDIMKDNSNNSLTSDDQNQILSQLQNLAKKSKQDSILSSSKIGISLDLIRSKKLENKFCKDLPKGGMLHVHPWGTLDRETLNLILSKQNPLIDLSQIKNIAEMGLDENTDGKIDSSLPKAATLNTLSILLKSKKVTESKIRFQDLTETEKKIFMDMFFMTSTSTQFSEFMGVFSMIFNTIFKKDSFSDPLFKVDEAMWSAFMSRAQNQKISYIEVTQTVNPKNGIDKFVKFKQAMKNKYNITVNTIAAFDRRQGSQKIYSQMKDFLNLPSTDAIVGINLVANEDLHPAKDYSAAYSLFTTYRLSTRPQLHATIHAGETGDIYNVRDALAMGSERIGHGVLLMKDLPTLNYVRNQKIPIEINLTSNLILNVANSIAEHPFLFYHRIGIPVSISTDDEGIFNTTMSKECELMISKTDINYTELKQIIINSISTSFASESEKQMLLKQLLLDLTQFESIYKH